MAPMPKKRDPFKLLRSIRWPLHEPARPTLLDGDDEGDKPLVIRMKPRHWNSLEAHCKGIGISRSKWVREAIDRQMEEEQQYLIEKAAEREATEARRAMMEEERHD